MVNSAFSSCQTPRTSALWPAAVGQLAAHSAQVLGAEKVAIVDSVGYRMDFAKKWLPGVHTIDFSKVQVGVTCQLLLYEAGHFTAVQLLVCGAR